MKKIAIIFLSSALIFQNAYVCSAKQGALDIYVRDGAEGGNGTIEKPFGNAIEARDYIRQLKKDGKYPEGGVNVNFREGVYFISKGLELGEEDSGTEDAPVTYRSYMNEQVKFVGGVEISMNDFKPISDASVKSRLPAESRNQVVTVNLRDYGLTTFDPLPQTGHSTAYFTKEYSDSGEDVPYNKKPAMELIYNDEVMKIARWPNEGYVRIGEALVSNKTSSDNVFKLDPEGTERMKRWGADDDIMAFAFWAVDWSDLTARVAVDVEKETIKTVDKLYHTPTAGQRIYFYNLLSELDVPTEWYLNRGTGDLYFYPPSNGGSVVVTNLDAPFFNFRNAKNIKIKGITLTGVRASAINIEDSENIGVELCVISNTTDKGINTAHVKNCEFISNHIYQTGAGGIMINGGNGTTLEPGGNLAENNNIHNYARITEGYSAAVQLSGIGNVARNNKMSGSNHLAMRITGGDHLVENNEITDVLRTSADMGAIYFYREKLWRNTVIQNNWFHDIKAEGSTASHGIQGIYYDEMNDGAIVKNNIFSNLLGDCIFVNGGRDHKAYNNVFYNCGGAEKISAIGMNTDYGYQNDDFFFGRFPELVSGIYKTEPFKKYEHLAEIMEERPKEPMYNKFWNNFVINCGYDFKWCEIESGYYDYLYKQNEITESKASDESMFVDAQNGNFNIKEEYISQFENGEAPDFKAMGMYTPWLARALRNNTVSMAIGTPMTYRNFDMTYIDADNLDIVPFISNNRTYVPVRYIAESFDGEVKYDDKTHTASIVMSGNKITIDNQNKELLLNGTKIEDAEPVVRGGRTYLPIRAVADSMDKAVTWYEKGVVIISEEGEVIDRDDTKLIDELYRRLT